METDKPDQNEAIEFYINVLNIATMYIKKIGRTIDKYTFLAECMNKYNAIEIDKDTLFEPDILEDSDEMFLLYVNKEHKFTCKCLLTIFNYLALNNIEDWEIIEC